ncbi:MAG: chlorosome envelope protein I [Methyloprofundus sp.]|nr:MAG: chlorosome envelope protein I [Methyloprofundus sp.]
MAHLSEIEGIGATYDKKLEKAGISSIENLLELGCEKKARKEIAAKTGISEKLILNWVNRADLARVKGVGTQYADLLEHAGVDTVPELAQRRADNLHAKMQEVNEAKNLVRSLPALSQVENWVAHAKELPRVINH